MEKKKKRRGGSQPGGNAASSAERKKAAILSALGKNLGNITKSCKAVGLSKQQFYNYIEADPDFSKACKEIKESCIDFAEDRLFSAMKRDDNGSVTATIFYLKTQGKERGYIEGQELYGKGGGPIAFNITTSIPRPNYDAPQVEAASPPEPVPIALQPIATKNAADTFQYTP